MTQTTALFFAFILYAVLPLAGLFIGYKTFKRLTKPAMLDYKAMPKLGYIPEKSLPTDIKMILTKVNDKGEKLRLIYGDTNRDGIIDDKDVVNETYVMINKLLEEHIPNAMMDYRSLNDLDEKHTKNTKIANSGITGKQALLDILNTIHCQFDDLLEASYHQDGQKLLITNRYLKQRFENQDML